MCNRQVRHQTSQSFGGAAVYTRGQAVIIFTLIMLFAGLIVFSSLTYIAASEVRIARRVIISEQSYFAAESGAEDMVYRFKTGKGTPSSVLIAVGGAIATTTVVSTSGQRDIVSRGEDASLVRIVKNVLTTGTGASFKYGTQVGDGGLAMDNNSQVNGSVYSNWHIAGNNTPRITGDAFAAASSTISGMIIDGNARASRFEENTIGGAATSSTVIYKGSVALNAWADTFSGGIISGNAYYNSSVSATTTVNGFRIQTSPAPANLPKLDMPISDQIIDDLEREASLLGTTTPASCPYKPDEDVNPTIQGVVTCDVTIEGTNIITLTGVLLVKGTLIMQNSAQLKLAPSFGSLSGVVIADNPTNRNTSSKVKIQNSAQILGSGQPSSYIMIVSRNNSAELGGNEIAIETGNSSAAAIYYAPHGLVDISNNVNLKEATAWKLHLQNLAVITYESGLSDVQFSSGSSGGWKIKSWTETQ